MQIQERPHKGIKIFMTQDTNEEDEIIDFYEEMLQKYEVATQKISECNKKIGEVATWENVPAESKNSSIEKLKTEIKKWEDVEKDALKTIGFIKKDLPDVENKFKIKKETVVTESLSPKEIKEFKKPVGFWGGVFNKFTGMIRFLENDAQKSVEDLGKKMNEELEVFEKRSTKNGVNFSRCNIENIVKAYREGKPVEYEVYETDKSDQKSVVGIAVGKVLQELFPNARMISNSDKKIEVKQLIKILEEKNHIKKDGDIIYFINPESENPEYREIMLQTQNGSWTGGALNAGTYLNPENLKIIHLVVWPNQLKKQQDKTWEILRVLGIESANYHDIFFDETVSAEKIVGTIKEEIEQNMLGRAN